MLTIKEIDYECCHVKNLKEGQVLLDDIIAENKVLIKKGDILTERTIYILKNLNIQSVRLVKEKFQRSSSESKKEEDVYYVENLFIEYMKNPIYYQYLLKFKKLGKKVSQT
ncbi:hypothetical protein RhiirA1_477431 [Rhizophagus irregularis]|uniref:Uncharacterized protein n=1 Tax=Rhizophagus irregularis TaxID=588596 RepID=A0A2N0QTL4_9GLOM|nr:hypothetical protein RhiirA1_477431 [Rhizophagus irregularis]